VIEVRRAEAADWQVVRDVRLRALADSPAAFASTLAREHAFGEDEWLRRIEPGPWFLAWADGRPVGCAACFVEQAGEWHLVAMWVSPDHRGTPAATQLVEAVVTHCRADGADAVRLWVADGNPRARRFYERLGFTPTGLRQPLPSDPAVSEELMRREFGTPPGPAQAWEAMHTDSRPEP
jgi:ribosomal protein S18 acetylase RimI-like enzyme